MVARERESQYSLMVTGNSSRILFRELAGGGGCLAWWFY